MLDELRDRMAAYLATHRVCIVSTQGMAGSSAVLARYHLVQDAVGRQALQVDCLVPRWADVTYHLEQNPELLVIVPDLRGDRLRWLQIRGAARPIPTCDWAEWHSAETLGVRPKDRYLAMRITPQRIDLVDESQNWGISETLDI